MNTVTTTGEKEVNKERVADDLKEARRKTLLLRQFAVRNSFKVPKATLEAISQLEFEKIPEVGENASEEAKKELASVRTRLDTALMALTAITLPITADSLAEGDPEDYAKFKSWLVRIGFAALLCAVIGLALATKFKQTDWIRDIGASLLAISLGSLGAVVYSFFDALGEIKAQTFSSKKDQYALYARLEIGVLLGWVFYLGFARAAFCGLVAGTNDRSQALYVMIPFLAGYSTRFVVGVLERIMAALLVALGIEGKQEARMKRTHGAAPDAPAS
jgi:hypothetical protein